MSLISIDDQLSVSQSVPHRLHVNVYWQNNKNTTQKKKGEKKTEQMKRLKTLAS